MSRRPPVPRLEQTGRVPPPARTDGRSPARSDATRMAEEQAALRRVATLVATGVSSAELFGAVTEEVGTLLGGDLAGMIRFEDDDGVTAVATWAAAGAHADVSGRWSLHGDRLARRIALLGAPAREDAWAEVDGPIATFVHEQLGVRSTVGSPIVVEGRVWGALFVHSTTLAHLPEHTEARLGHFTELVGTAIANAQARSELQALADEQAALRRVATLVARHPSPAEAMATIAEEVGTLLGVDGATILRFETDWTAVVVAGWGAPGLAELVGRRLDFGGDNPTASVFRTGRPARQEDWSSARGPFAEISRTVGITSAVAAPIVVEGRVWGTIVVVTLAGSPLPADTETRIGQFTELVATAIGNVNARSELTASRARIVRAGDHARRRFERDLHDGVQQRLVSLALELRGVEAVLATDPDTARAGLAAVREGLAEALDHLQELSRGLHPAILSQGGLAPALKALARRAAVAVRLDVDVAERVGEEVEVATYYVVSEAITNAVKHARASVVEVRVRRRDATVDVEVRDDGVGGADPSRGSGLVGLRDRVEALGGQLTVHSPQGHGTWLHVGLPAPSGATPPG